MLEQSNTWVEEVLDRCSKCAPLAALSVPASVSAHLKLAPEGQNTPYWRDMSLFGVAMCRQISSYAHFSLRNAQFSTVGGLLSPQIPVEKG